MGTRHAGFVGENPRYRPTDAAVHVTDHDARPAFKAAEELDPLVGVEHREGFHPPDLRPGGALLVAERAEDMEALPGVLAAAHPELDRVEREPLRPRRRQVALGDE